MQKREVVLLTVCQRFEEFDISLVIIKIVAFDRVAPSNLSLSANSIDNLCQNWEFSFNCSRAKSKGSSKDDRKLQRYPR